MANRIPKCIAPWVYLDILPDGVVVPCCSNPTELGDLKKQSLEEIWNGDIMKQFRLDMFKDNLPESCKFCDEPEITATLRYFYNQKFSNAILEVDDLTNDDGSVKEIKIKGFDFRLSNKCNFKCRTCWVKLSSSINFETRTNNLGEYYDQPILNITDYFDFKKMYHDNVNDLELIEFSGGEVLLMDEHYEMLQYFIDNNKQNQIELRYNTNLSNMTYKGYNVLDYWLKWDPSKLSVNVSIDEIGVRAEYIRYGTVWNSLIANIKTILDNFTSPNISGPNSPKFDLSVNLVVSIFNVYRIPEIISYLMDIGVICFDYEFSNFSLSLEGGMHDGIYDIELYPIHQRQLIKDKLILFAEEYPADISNQLSPIIRKLNSNVEPDKDKINKFLEKTNKLDEIRNQNLLEVIPELQCLVDYVS